MAKVFQFIAHKLAAIENCHISGNLQWQLRHTDDLDKAVIEYMPSGSGFDSGTTLVYNESSTEKLVFETAFHHMNENGYYTKWTHHKIIVTPSLLHSFHVKVTGRDYRDIKDYIYDCFSTALDRDFSEENEN